MLVRLTRQSPDQLAAPLAGADELIDGAAGGGGRVLRGHHSPAGDRRRQVGHAAGAGGDALVQADLLLRRGPVAARAPAPPAAGAAAARYPQRVLVPHVQPGRGVHARQVGVPLVRRLGPGVPLHTAGDGRPGLRQGPDRPDAVAELPAPDRPDARLRVELRRREPAGARVRGALPAEPGGRPRRGRPPVHGEELLPAAAELHLVGEPQGPDRAQRVRGRVPRPGQHRRVRPQRRAADRRQPGAGRRHRLDGDVQPEHARDGAGPARAGRQLRAVRAQVRRALLLDRGGHRPDGRQARRDVGRGGRLLLRRAAPPRRLRHPAEGPLAGRPAADLRRHRHRGRSHRAASADRRAGGLVPGAQQRPAVQHRRPAGARGERPPPAVPGQRGEAAAHPGPHARRGAVPRPARDQVDLAPAPGGALRLRRARRRSRGAVRAGRVDQRNVRRQLQLARAGLVPDQPAADPGADHSTTGTTATA